MDSTNGIARYAELCKCCYNHEINAGIKLTQSRNPSIGKERASIAFHTRHRNDETSFYDLCVCVCVWVGVWTVGIVFAEVKSAMSIKPSAYSLRAVAADAVAIAYRSGPCELVMSRCNR